MPRNTVEESLNIRKWIMAALKDGANSPRKVQTWIEQQSEITAPSIPTIAGVMKEEGYVPVGFVWEKKKERTKS
jgi:hypothetical protein